jgi:hypothetical protein
MSQGQEWKLVGMLGQSYISLHEFNAALPLELRHVELTRRLHGTSCDCTDAHNTERCW